MESHLKILLIDGDEAGRENVKHLLKKSNLNVNLNEAGDCNLGIEIIKAQEFDCILVDYHLPDAKGIEVIDQIREVNTDRVPVIVLAGMGSEKMAVEVLKKGAADYVSKNELNSEVLKRSITNAVQIHQFQQKASAAERALLEREKQYRTIVETVSDIIIRLDVKGKIEFVNPAIRFLGYEPSEIVGQHIEKFVKKVEGVDYHDGLISQITTRGVGLMATNNLEVEFLVKQESPLWEENKFIPVLMDAFGLWDVSDEMAFKGIGEKNFLGTLCIARNITELKAMEEELLGAQSRLIDLVEELKELATKDALTGIANRRFFDEYLQKEWKRAQRDRNVFSLVMIDLDFFKSYNDTYGHQKGDDCLKKVANVIEAAMKRPADMAARFGGEEFVLVLPETSFKGAMRLSEELRKSIFDLNLEHKLNPKASRVTISLGVATTLADKEGCFKNLISNADKALYTAKNNGRNQVCSFKEGVDF